jgi:hypothetical protein
MAHNYYKQLAGILDKELIPRRSGPWWDNYEPKENSAPEDIYKKISHKEAKSRVMDILMANMSPVEIEAILERSAECNKKHKVKDLDKARMILLYPSLEKHYPFEDLHENTQLALLFQDFDRFIGQIDVNLLTRKQIQLFFRVEPKRRKKVLGYLGRNMLPERMKEIFTMGMWRDFIDVFPQKVNMLDIKEIRNQTELRHFILDKPHVLRYATLDDMKNCVIDGPTWVRIVTKLPPGKRKHVPAGFARWVERDIFKEMLGGRKFKKFDKTWKDGLVDNKIE